MKRNSVTRFVLNCRQKRTSFLCLRLSGNELFSEQSVSINSCLLMVIDRCLLLIHAEGEQPLTVVLYLLVTRHIEHLTPLLFVEKATNQFQTTVVTSI